jgi:hypothetical protein
MGDVISDYNDRPGWVHASKTCLACGHKWEEVYHLWLAQKFKTWCPNCPEKKATLRNVIQFRRKQNGP